MTWLHTPRHTRSPQSVPIRLCGPQSLDLPETAAYKEEDTWHIRRRIHVIYSLDLPETAAVGTDQWRSSPREEERERSFIDNQEVTEGR